MLSTGLNLHQAPKGGGTEWAAASIYNVTRLH